MQEGCEDYQEVVRWVGQLAQQKGGIPSQGAGKA